MTDAAHQKFAFDTVFRRGRRRRRRRPAAQGALCGRRGRQDPAPRRSRKAGAPPIAGRTGRAPGPDARHRPRPSRQAVGTWRRPPPATAPAFAELAHGRRAQNRRRRAGPLPRGARAAPPSTPWRREVEAEPRAHGPRLRGRRRARRNGARRSGRGRWLHRPDHRSDRSGPGRRRLLRSTGARAARPSIPKSAAARIAAALDAALAAEGLHAEPP